MTLIQPNDEQILVMAPTGRDADLICDLLQRAGFICISCPTPEFFFEALLHGAGALLIAVEALSSEMVQSLAHVMAEQPAWSDLTLVLLNQRGQAISESNLRQHLGVNVNLAILERPVQPATLLTLFQSLIQARRRQYQIRELLATLVAQTATLQQEIEQRRLMEAEQQRLLHELAQERGRLQTLTQTLEQKVRAGTQQIRNLAAQLSLAEHSERQRVARILHDHVQQMLYATQFQIQLLDMKLSDPEPEMLHSYINEMQRLLDETVYSVRTLSVDLSPPVLEHEGLDAALRWLSTQMQERYQLTTWIEAEGDCASADKHLRVVIFQIVRELLFNVFKHAGVDQAWVMLHCEDGMLKVTVKDEGVGFDATTLLSAETSTGLGLSGIGKRLDLFNGQLSLESAPGAGTVVQLVMPLE